jgi:hypothetical protein
LRRPYKRKRPQLEVKQAGAVNFLGREAAKTRPAYATSDHKGGVTSVRYPTDIQKTRERGLFAIGRELT